MALPDAARADSQLVERDSELQLIDGVLRSATAGEGRLLIFEGPAGIGKTSLLEATRERAEAAHLVVLPARGHQLEGGFPYGVVRQLLEPPLRSASQSTQARLLAGAAVPAATVLLDAPPGSADPMDQAFSVVHGLYWLVANLATEAPVVLLLDDVQLADAPSLRYFVYLARRLDRLPAAIVATLRTGEQGPGHELVREFRASPSVQIAEPAALTEGGVARVLTAQLGGMPDPGFTRSCRTATGGNPFYVRELASMLKADGIEATAAAAQRIYDASPETIGRAALTRLGRVPNGVRLAQAIAVLGSDSGLPLAASLAELRENEALAALDALVAADMIAPGRELEFRHPIVRAAIYDALPAGERSALHHRAALLLTSVGADLDAISGHLLLTQPTGTPETIATLREAAKHALALGAPDGAARYLTRALAEEPGRTQRASVLLELATAEQHAGHPAAFDHFEQVRRLADEPSARATALIGQAEVVWYSTGDGQRWLELLGHALTELGDANEALRLRAETLHAATSMYDPRLVHTFDERRPILEQVARSGRPGTRPLALALSAWAAQRDEPSDRVMELLELGWDDGAYLDDGDSITLLPQGMAAWLVLDELARLSAVVHRFSEVAQASGSVISCLLASAHDAWLDTARGNLTAAAAQMRSCLERAVELDLQLAVVSILWYCADVLVERPDAADFATLAQTIELGPGAYLQSGALLIAARGRLRYAAGERDAAVADLRHVGALNEALGFTNPAGCQSWRTTLALMLERSDRDESLALVGAELDDAKASGLPRRIGVALRAHGLLALDADAGLHTLEEAVAVLARSPAKLEHARALVEFGAALRRSGKRTAARKPLSEGLDLATACGAPRLSDRARTELVAAGARPRRERTTGRDALTPTELRVAQMAAEGRTTREIAQALFVSTKTIDAHLSHCYTKLGINSRKHLDRALTPARGEEF